jgi:UDP-2,3-diacylglucosamine pyrophosphatase LpxH
MAGTLSSMLERLYVVSDLHIGPGGPLDSFHSGPALAAFVRSVDPRRAALVVAGDFLDLLQVPSRPPRLDLEGTPVLVRQLAHDVLAKPWGRELFVALGDFVRGGGLWVVLPGNHDLELYHPATAEILGSAAGLAAGAHGFVLHNAADPWRNRVGRWEVVIGHGHLGDPWNRISPRRIQRALENGEPSLPLPPGSLLVLETINAFKRACDPWSSTPRFPFVDLLKPEGPWVPLLLLAFDPQLALAHLPGVARQAREALMEAVAQRLLGGAKLASTPPVGGADRDRELADVVVAEVAAGLVAALTAAELAAPRALLDHLDSAFGGAGPAGQRMLTAGPPLGLFLRAAHRLWHDGGSFFDTASLGTLDRAIVAEHLPEGSRPRVVLAGHTHAAREARLSPDRIYLNTGTWTDLLQVPEKPDTAALVRWADELRGGRAPRLRRLHYAEITPETAGLKVWSAALRAGGDSP